MNFLIMKLLNILIDSDKNPLKFAFPKRVATALHLFTMLNFPYTHSLSLGKLNLSLTFLCLTTWTAVNSPLTGLCKHRNSCTMPSHHALALEKTGTDCFAPWLTGCPTSFHELAQIFEYSSENAFP